MPRNKTDVGPDRLGTFSNRYLKTKQSKVKGGLDLTNEGKKEFLAWYDRSYPAVNADPYKEAQFYDYERAWAGGDVPDYAQHGDSLYKKYGHPRLFLGDHDTSTGFAPTKDAKQRQATAIIDYEAPRLGHLTGDFENLVKNIEDGEKHFKNGRFRAFLGAKGTTKERRWTVGHGHVGDDVGPTTSMSTEEAQKALDQDLYSAVGVVERTFGTEGFKKMPDRHKQMATQLVFNLGGKSWKQYEKFRHAMSRNDEEGMRSEHVIDGQDRRNTLFDEYFWKKGE